MKYMIMRNKCYAFDLQLFADEGNDGEEAGDEGDDPDDESNEGGDDADEKKYSDKDMEEAIKKRLARERRKWKRKQSAASQENNNDKPDTAGGKEKESEDARARKEAESKASRMEMKIACFEADVAKESVDDVAALAQAYMAADEDLDLEEAIEKVVKKYPQFKKGAADPDEEEDKSTKGSWGQRQKGKGAKKMDGVEAAFLRKNPGLKID